MVHSVIFREDYPNLPRSASGCCPPGLISWIFGLWFCFFGIAFAIAGSEVGSAGGIWNKDKVGEITLVLGASYVLGDRERVEIAEGMSVNVGDVIFTESNGHVHIRFIDNALVSVRPSSTLHIERYEYDSLSPEKSSVKFNLEEGVARAISGEAARAAKRRFRLNTPIAAIGVRGTDFVVSADAQSTRALVNEGAIVMAPFSSLCQADALGPCSENAVELEADSLQVLELRGASLAPQIAANQPVQELNDLSDRLRSANSKLSAAASDADDGKTAEAYRENVTTGSVRQVSENVVISAPAPNVPSAPDYTPMKPLSELDTSNNRLVWGRFGDGRGAGELLSVERLEASMGRAIAISASDYMLYRMEPNGDRLDANLGVVGFQLSSAQAFFDSDSGEFAMRVGEGRLNVNFVNSTFETSLGLGHENLGIFDFRGAGRVADGGYLIGNGSGGDSVVGAVSTDGFEAGYFFEQFVDGGRISGLTLWGGQ